MMALIEGLRKTFHYPDAPEFLESTQGKSEAFKEMRVRLASDPVKRADSMKRLDVALEELLTSTDAYTLVPQRKHPELAELESIARALSNSD